jgi:hypothetical protein
MLLSKRLAADDASIAQAADAFDAALVAQKGGFPAINCFRS